jgi:hypothetical protein
MKKTPKTVELKTAKANGCPAFKASNRIHLPTYKAWRKKHPRPATPTAPALPRLTDAQVEELGSLEGTLRAAIRDELETSRALEQARATSNAGAIADLSLAVGRCRKNRLALESALTRLKIQRGTLIGADQAIIQMGKMWYPILAEMRKLPRQLAQKLAPGNEIEAERTIDKEVESIIGQMQRSVTAEPDPSYHLNLFLAVTLREKGKAGLLAKIDEARKMVESAEEGKEKP